MKKKYQIIGKLVFDDLFVDLPIKQPTVNFSENHNKTLS